ncbi:hypothetical protein COOONC_05127 [Cooperia oncophora]
MFTSFRTKMRLGQSLATENDVNNTYEFAVEARAAEPLKIVPYYMVRHALSSEFARVCRQPIDGMYVVPSAEDQFRWFGLLFVRRGVFGGGIFRFNVRIPHDFPNTTSLPGGCHVKNPPVFKSTSLVGFPTIFQLFCY